MTEPMFGPVLRDLIKSRGLSLSAVARRRAVAPSTVSTSLSKIGVTERTVAATLDVLGLTWADFFKAGAALARARARSKSSGPAVRRANSAARRAAAATERSAAAELEAARELRQ